MGHMVSGSRPNSVSIEDFDRYCTLGAGNADIKQSDKGMAGPPPGSGEGDAEGGPQAKRPLMGSKPWPCTC